MEKVVNRAFASIALASCYGETAKREHFLLTTENQRPRPLPSYAHVVCRLFLALVIGVVAAACQARCNGRGANRQ